jgi:hypothetical protein
MGRYSHNAQQGIPPVKKPTQAVIIGAVFLLWVICRASGTATAPDIYVLSSDHTRLLPRGGPSSQGTVRLDQEHLATAEDGNQHVLVHYAADQLRVFVRQSELTYRLAANYRFDDEMTAPTCVLEAHAVGSGVILVQLHCDPSNSWFALCDTRTGHVRTYWASAFACSQSARHVAYISHQPHFGTEDAPAPVYVDGHVKAVIAAKDYWDIRWDKQLSAFILFNQKGEQIVLSSDRGELHAPSPADPD